MRGRGIGVWTVALIALATGCTRLEGCGCGPDASSLGGGDPPAPTTPPREAPAPPPVQPVPMNPPPTPGGEAPTGGLRPCPEQTAGGAGGDATGAVRVEWSNIRRTSGCWFFSGPGTIGRDTQLGDGATLTSEGASITLAFGPARFTGHGGETVRLSRSSDHDSGGTWQVTETIEGRWTGSATRRYTDTPCRLEEDHTFRGTYTYHECQRGAGQPCPGHCTITATVVIRPAGAGG